MEEGIQEPSQNPIVLTSGLKLAAQGTGQALGRWCGRMMDGISPGASWVGDSSGQRQ